MNNTDVYKRKKTTIGSVATTAITFLNYTYKKKSTIFHKRKTTRENKTNNSGNIIEKVKEILFRKIFICPAFSSYELWTKESICLKRNVYENACKNQLKLIGIQKVFCCGNSWVVVCLLRFLNYFRPIEWFGKTPLSLMAAVAIGLVVRVTHQPIARSLLVTSVL